ncbi:hypothetical protein J6590_037523 [Homalodisca vitripennis]|nr:hypothetical protein J6590_037523 [Homalodisca vitripennis]
MNLPHFGRYTIRQIPDLQVINVYHDEEVLRGNPGSHSLSFFPPLRHNLKNKMSLLKCISYGNFHNFITSSDVEDKSDSFTSL